MRTLTLLAALAAFTLPAHAGGSGHVEELTKTQKRMIATLAKRMERNLRRRHAKEKNSPFEKPVVRYDPASRTITVTQQLTHYVTENVGDAIRQAVANQKPNLCLALRPRAVRGTALTIAVRAVEPDGEDIAVAKASQEEC